MKFRMPMKANADCAELPWNDKCTCMMYLLASMNSIIIEAIFL